MVKEETDKTREKMREATSIEISVEAYDKLRSLQDSLQKILRRKKVSFDQVVKVMFAVTRLDDTLIQMELEA